MKTIAQILSLLFGLIKKANKKNSTNVLYIPCIFGDAAASNICSSVLYTSHLDRR